MTKRTSFSENHETREIPSEERDSQYRENIKEDLDQLKLILKKRKPWYAFFKKIEIEIGFSDYLEGSKTDEDNDKIIISTLEKVAIKNEIVARVGDYPYSVMLPRLLFEAVARNIVNPNEEVLRSLYRASIKKIYNDCESKETAEKGVNQAFNEVRVLLNFEVKSRNIKALCETFFDEDDTIYSRYLKCVNLNPARSNALEYVEQFEVSDEPFQEGLAIRRGKFERSKPDENRLGYGIKNYIVNKITTPVRIFDASIIDYLCSPTYEDRTHIKKLGLIMPAAAYLQNNICSYHFNDGSSPDPADCLLLTFQTLGFFYKNEFNYNLLLGVYEGMIKLAVNWNEKFKFDAESGKAMFDENATTESKIIFDEKLAEFLTEFEGHIILQRQSINKDAFFKALENYRNGEFFVDEYLKYALERSCNMAQKSMEEDPELSEVRTVRTPRAIQLMEGIAKKGNIISTI